MIAASLKNTPKRKTQMTEGGGGSRQKRPKMTMERTVTQKRSPLLSKSDADSNGAASASGKGLLSDAQMSPKKALRAAMLKSRYADTILKAQLLINAEKPDPMKMQQEKEKLGRELEEAEFEFKKHREREREREAARIALQNMKNTAGIELNLDTQREFEILIGCSPSSPWNPTHRSAECVARIKEDEAVVNEDIEEGEIVS